MTIHAVYNNMQIENHVIEFRDRPAGSVSKLNTYSDGMRVLSTIIRLYRDYKPFCFFSCIAALLALLALIFFIPVWMEYVRTGLVLRFPTLIVCGFVMLAALQALFAGIILHNLTLNHRREFELMRNSLRRGKER